MTDHNLSGASTEEIEGRVFHTAAQALANHTHDSTGSASYNRRRAYDVAFDAAMDVLREVPVEERPEDLVSEVDAVCALIRERDHSRDDVEAALRERANEAHEALRDLQEDLEHNDRVTLTYIPEDAEERVTVEGTVCKSNAGGVRVLPDSGRHLLVLKTGWRVTRTHVDGGALRSRSVIGEHATITPTGERGHVSYSHHHGWTHEAPIEEAA